MTDNSAEDNAGNRGNFICGVVEGFYGRPWTTEQRKDLFQKLKKWGMDTYVYAPKDDYKHRAYWRELYTVEEAEHLTSLISAAKDQGITFCYALSPGLDITYSSQKEITVLKRKLEQVSQFGCTCFALLFDDIEPEMTEADKQIFQSFAHAQVSVTNEVHQHLGCPRFLLCPTQYCSTRAVPTVISSEYLNTLGTKLSQQIDILWTGPKVISKTLTTECIEEITQVLRRPPIIWDNLHANDYDQKRIYLGPYCGRSPELIPLLRGVLTNPNCEYNANMIAIRTLALWAQCTRLAPEHNDAVSWDIKLERESEQGICDDEPPLSISKNVYHPRQALKHAITEWLPEFSIPKTSQGPVIKPQPVIVPSVPIIPIVPSINTCMSLMTTTCTTNTTSVAETPLLPTVSTTHLQALADVCDSRGNVIKVSESANPVSNPVMNSLVSPTKVILNDSIPNPIIPIASSNISLPQEIPLSTLPASMLPISTLGQMVAKKIDEDLVIDDERVSQNGDMSVGASPHPSLCSACEPLEEDQNEPSDVVMNEVASENGSMMVEPSNSPLSGEMMVESCDRIDVVDDSTSEELSLPDAHGLTIDDLVLLCDMFYLPFEHGARAIRLLNDYHWLTSHLDATSPKASTPEKSEWHRRRSRFAWWCGRTRRLLRRLTTIRNKELCTELQPYAADLCSVLALLEGFVMWLELGKCPPDAAAACQGSYNWFSKGWRESFCSGVQEPWVFRGGVASDLRRLLPVECGPNALKDHHAPCALRPYAHSDEEPLCLLAFKKYRNGGDLTPLFPNEHTLAADRLIAPYVTLSPEFCMVLEDSDSDQDNTESVILEDACHSLDKPRIVGYACAAINCRMFMKKQEFAWIPEMCKKYPLELIERADVGLDAKEYIMDFHNFVERCSVPDSISRSHPAVMSCFVRNDIGDEKAAQRLVTCLLAALRACGASAVHTVVKPSDNFTIQFYNKLGFAEIMHDMSKLYMGRSF